MCQTVHEYPLQIHYCAVIWPKPQVATTMTSTLCCALAAAYLSITHDPVSLGQSFMAVTAPAKDGSRPTSIVVCSQWPKAVLPQPGTHVASSGTTDPAGVSECAALLTDAGDLLLKI